MPHKARNKLDIAISHSPWRKVLPVSKSIFKMHNAILAFSRFVYVSDEHLQKFNIRFENLVANGHTQVLYAKIHVVVVVQYRTTPTPVNAILVLLFVCIRSWTVCKQETFSPVHLSLLLATF